VLKIIRDLCLKLIAYNFIDLVLIVKNVTTMNRAIFFLSVFAYTILICVSCNRKFIEPDQVGIMSTEEIDNHLREQVKLRGKVDWAYVPDEVLYSATRHSNSMLFITYSSTPNGRSLPMNDENYKKTGKLPQEWIKVRDEIIQHILEKERAYRKQPELTTSQILFGRYEPNETLACITVIFSDPSLIPDLRENKLIRTLEPGYAPDSMDWYIEK